MKKGLKLVKKGVKGVNKGVKSAISAVAEQPKALKDMITGADEKPKLKTKSSGIQLKQLERNEAELDNLFEEFLVTDALIAQKLIFML